MHNWAKQMMECVKVKVDGMGIDNIEGEHLEELKSWVCIAKDIAEYDYYYNIVKAMKESGEEYGKDYDENGRYYSRTRDSRGRYMRRGYDMSVDDYKEHSPEYYRDMDRDSKNVMYYTESDMNSGANSNSKRGYESRYDNARRGYEQAKALNPNDDPSNMKAIENVFSVLEGDLNDMKGKMTGAEKTMARNKLNNIANMLN